MTIFVLPGGEPILATKNASSMKTIMANRAQAKVASTVTTVDGTSDKVPDVKTVQRMFG